MKAMLNGFSLSMPTAAGLFSSWFLLAGPVLAEAPAITRVSEGLERSAAVGGDTAAFNLFGEAFVPGQTELFYYRDAASGAPQGAAELKLAAVPPAGAAKAVLHRVLAQVIVGELPVTDKVEPTVLWVKTPAGMSAPWVINRPRLQWLSTDLACAGERVRGFGRNLKGVGGEPRIFLRRKGDAALRALKWAGGGIDGQIKGDAYSLRYETSFLLPDDITPGEYEVLQYNGSGGATGWSDPAGLTVRIREAEPTFKVSVKDFGAVGDGLADDTKALAEAILAAHKAGGGTVKLPAGVYLISKTLVIYPKVSLAGAGMEATIVRSARAVVFGGELPMPLEGGAADWAPYYKKFKPMFWVQTKSTLSDMAFDYNGLEQGCAVLVAEPEKGVSEDLKFLRLKGIYDQPEHVWDVAGIWRPEPASGQAIRDTRRTLVADCVNFGVWGMYDGKHYYAQSLRNVNGGFGATGEYGCIREKNLVRNVFGRRGFTNGTHYFSNRHNIYLRNRVEENFNSDGEAYLLEGGGASGVWAGRITEGLPDGIRVKGLDWDALPIWKLKGRIPHAVAVVLRGRGLGQYRMVKKTDGEVLRLQKPWDVTPDQSSFVAVKYVFLENLLVENETFATGGVRFYGNVIGNVAAGQKDAHSEFEPAGATHWGTADNPQNTEIGLFNEFRDGVSLDPPVYWNGNLTASRFGTNTMEAYTSLGNEIRGNVIKGGGAYAATWPGLAAQTWTGAISLQDSWLSPPGNSGWLPFDDPRPGPPQIVYNLVCGNRIVDPGTGTGISISPRVAGSGLIRNRIEGAKKPILDMGVDTLIIP